MIARAYAKINLGLEVLFRRNDGYHEIRTILQTIDLHDELRFERRPAGIELAVDDPEAPVGRDNLVVRAAETLARTLGTSPGARIGLVKRIPSGQGLGGGSADAALTLLALNELWQARLPDVELHRMASGLGMDVPFFLVGGTVLATGRGDEVCPLAAEVDAPIVLILPDFGISTAQAYGNLILTKRQAGLTLPYFALPDPGDDEGLFGLINDLESATGDHSPLIHGYKQSLLELGATASLMSGSGSAVFGIFRDDATARSAAIRLESRGIRAIATRTLKRVTYREKRLEFEPTRSGEP